ncbi:MAG: glycerol-3-phosphate 1-O-acyltransferase PlsY [Vulcanimicrobiaceae bacterium]
MSDVGIARTIVVPAHWTYPLLWSLAGWPYLAFAFALGAIPFGLVISRAFFGSDIRASGSGNIGAANALRTLGRKAGVAVLVLDALKGALAVAVAWHLWLFVPLSLALFGADGAGLSFERSAGPIWPLVPLAGLAAVLGHCYTPWLRGRGGKGVATFLGATCALSWESAVAFVVVWLAIVLPTGFASLGSMLGTVVAGAIVVATGGRYGDSAVVFAVLSSAIVVLKHRENIGRLRTGTENRLALLKR